MAHPLLTSLAALGATEIVTRLGLRFHRHCMPDGRLCFLEARPGDCMAEVSGEALGVIEPQHPTHPLSLHAPYPEAIATPAVEGWLRRWGGNVPLISVDPPGLHAEVLQAFRAAARRLDAPAPPPGRLRVVR